MIEKSASLGREMGGVGGRDSTLDSNSNRSQIVQLTRLMIQVRPVRQDRWIISIWMKTNAAGVADQRSSPASWSHICNLLLRFYFKHVKQGHGMEAKVSLNKTTKMVFFCTWMWDVIISNWKIENMVLFEQNPVAVVLLRCCHFESELQAVLCGSSLMQ